MRRPFFIAYSALFVCGLVAAEPQKGFYRYPALHGDTVVFAAEGDLWRVGTAGGVARRLTTHPGEESRPRISPDGSVLAFTASYEGPVELYTMPVDGGLPVRRSYEAESSHVTTWTPGGELVYTTTHYATLPNPQLVALDIETGVRARIPLAQATEGSYAASGRSLYFVRPAFHRNVTKRYKGGTARKIWKFTDATFQGQDTQLEAAIAYLLEQIRSDPRPVPNAPPYPDMSFEYPTTPTSEGVK